MDDATGDEALAIWSTRLDALGIADPAPVLTALFVHVDEGGRRCRCSCHPSIGSPDQHGDLGCPCTQTADQRDGHWRRLFAQIDEERAIWEASEEGRAELARRAAESAELDAWIAEDPGVDIESWGGCFPEQWTGTIDGHSFYFREKRGHWSIEIDLLPTGRTYQRLVVDEDPDTEGDELRTVEEPVLAGTLIAEGRDTDLGVTPLHHGRFIVHAVRAHLRRSGCPHRGARRFCPECGAEMV